MLKSIWRKKMKKHGLEYRLWYIHTRNALIIHVITWKALQTNVWNERRHKRLQCQTWNLKNWPAVYIAGIFPTLSNEYWFLDRGCCTCPSKDLSYAMEYYPTFKKKEILSLATIWMNLGGDNTKWNELDRKTNTLSSHFYVESEKKMDL